MKYRVSKGKIEEYFVYSNLFKNQATSQDRLLFAESAEPGCIAVALVAAVWSAVSAASTAREKFDLLSAREIA